MRRLAVASILAIFVFAPAAGAQEVADLAIVNGRVYTLDTKGGTRTKRLTIEEAIEAYTKGPAWASFEEDIKGTLTAGKLADVAVFDTNLVEVGKSDPKKLLDAKVLYTVAGGKVVYARP